MFINSPHLPWVCLGDTHYLLPPLQFYPHLLRWDRSTSGVGDFLSSSSLQGAGIPQDIKALFTFSKRRRGAGSLLHNPNELKVAVSLAFNSAP